MFFIVSGVGNWMMHLEFCLNKDEDIEEVMSEIRKEHKCVFFPMHITPQNTKESLQQNERTTQWEEEK